MKVWLDGQYLGDYKIMLSVNNNPYALDNRTVSQVTPNTDRGIPLNELTESLVIRTNSFVCRLADIQQELGLTVNVVGGTGQPSENTLQGKLIETGQNLNIIEDRLLSIERLLGICKQVETANPKSIR